MGVEKIRSALAETGIDVLVREDVTARTGHKRVFITTFRRHSVTGLHSRAGRRR
ncbi:hypothetical protein ACFUJR_09520 [Streptomyces sp. NPDC057271]|uniref:hypothetical protein n=1 Tax=unclassified Streptomyces TaxID=2593676 RepID=UPI00363B7C2B